MNLNFAMKNPSELFCTKIQRLTEVGKSMKVDSLIEKASESDQRKLHRNHSLWRNFQNTIEFKLKSAALEGKSWIDLPVEIFPIREKIYEWCINNGFTVFISTEKNFETNEETLDYLNGLFEEVIFEKKVYFLMTIDWSEKEPEVV